MAPEDVLYFVHIPDLLVKAQNRQQTPLSGLDNRITGGLLQVEKCTIYSQEDQLLLIAGDVL